MRRRLRFICSCLLIVACLGCEGAAEPRLYHGRVDLFSWDFERDGPLAMDGGWLYASGVHGLKYFGIGQPGEDQSLEVVHDWRDLLAPPRVSMQGAEVYSYYGEIVNHDVSSLVALRLPICVRACRIYVGKDLVALRGSLDGGSAGFAWSYKRTIRVDTEVIAIPITVQSLDYAAGQAIRENRILVGLEDDLLARTQLYTTLDVALGAALLLLGSYFTGIYLLRRKDRYPIYFGVFCLLLAVRAMFGAERLVFAVYPAMDASVYRALDVSSLLLCILAFVLYFRSLFRASLPAWPGYAAVSVVVPGILLGIFAPDWMVLYFVYGLRLLAIPAALLMAFLLMRVHGSRRWDAALFFPGFVILCGTIFVHHSYEAGVVDLYRFVPPGYLVFMLSQAVLLSTRFSGDFIEVEELSTNLTRTNRELRQLRDQLEDRVRDRTRALEAAREEAVKLNEFARRINSSSDLDTILKQIFLYVETNFGLDCSFLQFVDNEKRDLYYYALSNRPSGFTEADFEYIQSVRVPLRKEQSLIWRAYQTGNPVFYKSLRTARPEEQDRKLLERLRFGSFLLLPLMIEDKVIALVYFTAFRDNFRLDREEIASIARICDQIAGAIRNSLLLEQVQREQHRSDRLLLNILPRSVANELKDRGYVEPMLFESATICFTDFRGFTRIAESMDPSRLIATLDEYFTAFDEICDRFGVEKLKTIGDSYMCAGGLPRMNMTHPVDVALAGLVMQAHMRNANETWEIRLGIHTGPVMSGVIGKRKFAYDVWGDTVNLASRMQTEGEAGAVNVSAATHRYVAPFFETRRRGIVPVKNHESVEMFFVDRLKPEYSQDDAGIKPNATFERLYEGIKNGSLFKS